MRLSKLVRLALIYAMVLPQLAFSYSIVLNYTAFDGVADFASVSPFGSGAFHRDSFYVTNNPGLGEHQVGLFGNDGQVGSSILVTPGPGDSPSGIVQVLLHYSFVENLSLTFDNYQPTAYNSHYGCNLTVQSSDLQYTDTYSLPTDGTDIILNLMVGTQEGLYFSVDASAVHDSYDNQSWQPAVIDPAIQGLAEVYITAGVTPIFVQVVPEPGSLGLCAAGLILMGVRSVKRQRRRG